MVEEEEFDIFAFLGKYRSMFLLGLDFSAGGPNYEWAMRELRKLSYPYPLVVSFSSQGQIEVHFSRELALPAIDELDFYVRRLL